MISRRSSDSSCLPISAATWLSRHGYSSALLRWYVEYACRDDYGASLERTSAWAMLFYFCARIPEPEQPSQPFLSWPEGNGRLVAHLANVVGSRLRARALVTDVSPTADGVELAVLDADTRKLSRLHARAAILATPSFVNARMSSNAFCACCSACAACSSVSSDVRPPFTLSTRRNA